MLVCLEKCLYFINNVTSKINTFVNQLYMKNSSFCGFIHELLYISLIQIVYGNYDPDKVSCNFSFIYLEKLQTILFSETTVPLDFILKRVSTRYKI